jgi:photosystem II stability/assembly factor-like uncharacterized protein
MYCRWVSVDSWLLKVVCVCAVTCSTASCQTTKARPPETHQATGNENTGAWINIFPVGPRIYQLSADVQNPKRIYASTHRGLFATADAGMTWRSIYPIATADNLLFAQSLSSPNTMIIGVRVGQQGGLAKSTDGGVTWQRIAAQDIKWPPISVAIDPLNADVVYAMSETVLNKSLNGGRTWGDITPQVSNAEGTIRPPLHFIWVDPDKSTHLMLGCSRSGDISELVESDDGGMSWNASKVGAVAKKNPYSPENNEGLWPFLAPDPTNHDVLFAISPSVGDHVNHIPGSVISLDAGRSWKDITITNDRRVVSMRYVLWSKSIDRYLYVGTDDGLFLSPDAGTHWEKALPYGIEAITESPSHEIYAATWFGVVKSANKGKSWHHASLGIPVRMDESPTSNATPGVPVVSFGSAGNAYVFGNDLVYVGGRGGYWTSSDSGLTWGWHAISSDFLNLSNADVMSPTQGANVRQIVEAKDKTLFLSLFEYGNVSSEAKFIRVQASGKATKLNPNNPASMIGVSPVDTQMLYMTGGGGSQPTPDSGTFLSKSEDAGFSWRTFDLNPWIRSTVAGSGVARVPMFVVSQRSPRTVYALCWLRSQRLANFAQQFALLRTTDGGDNWHDVFPEKMLIGARNWQTLNFYPSDFARLAVDPSNDSTVYLSFDNILLKSADGGGSWSQLPISAGKISAVAVSPQAASILFVATDSGVWVTKNGGTRWETLNQGLFGDKVTQVVVAANGVFARGQNGVYQNGDMRMLETSWKSRWDALEQNPGSDPLFQASAKPAAPQ